MDERDEIKSLNLLMGLVLRKVQDQEGTFRRIGLLRLVRKNWFEGAPRTRITII